MRADHKALLDANVIATFSVFDLYLRLGEEPRLLLPRWSNEILVEAKAVYTERLKKRWEPEQVDRMFGHANRAFPDALVEGYEPLIPACTNDEKDRHVLAAAIRGNIQTIVTYNLKDFRSADLSPWDITAVHPSEYLITLYDHGEGIVLDRLGDIARLREIEPEEALSRLGRAVPDFALYVAGELGWKIDKTAWP